MERMPLCQPPAYSDVIGKILVIICENNQYMYRYVVLGAQITTLLLQKVVDSSDRGGYIDEGDYDTEL